MHCQNSHGSQLLTTKIVDTFTSTRSSQSTSGIGDSSPRSNTFATSHSWFTPHPLRVYTNRSSDPFIEMERSNKTYGFTIAVKELKETVPNIFRYASAWMRVNNVSSKGLWEMFVEKDTKKEAKKLPKDDPKYKKPLPEEILKTEPGAGSLPDIDPDAMEGETYNMCHFWSNFEIARLDWFRSKEYNDFFDMMDRSGGFWMERVSFGKSLTLSQGTKLLTFSSVG
jgi:mannosyltransferase